MPKFSDWRDYIKYLNTILRKDNGVWLYNGLLLKNNRNVYSTSVCPKVNTFSYNEASGKWYDTILLSANNNSVKFVTDYVVNTYRHLNCSDDMLIRYFNSLAMNKNDCCRFVYSMQLVLLRKKLSYRRWLKFGFNGINFKSSETMNDSSYEKLVGRVSAYISDKSCLNVPIQYNKRLNFKRFKKDENTCIGVRLNVIETIKSTGDVSIYPIFVPRSSSFFEFLVDFIEGCKNFTSTGIFVQEMHYDGSKYRNAVVGNKDASKVGVGIISGDDNNIAQLLKDSYIIGY